MVFANQVKLIRPCPVRVSRCASEALKHITPIVRLATGLGQAEIACIPTHRAVSTIIASRPLGPQGKKNEARSKTISKQSTSVNLSLP
jgi:hypothetical protein